MRRTVIPAGSTPSEKERGIWVKLTREEADALAQLAENEVTEWAPITSSVELMAHLTAAARKLREELELAS